MFKFIYCPQDGRTAKNQRPQPAKIHPPDVLCRPVQYTRSPAAKVRAMTIISISLSVTRIALRPTSTPVTKPRSRCLRPHLGIVRGQRNRDFRDTSRVQKEDRERTREVGFYRQWSIPMAAAVECLLRHLDNRRGRIPRSDRAGTQSSGWNPRKPNSQWTLH